MTVELIKENQHLCTVLPEIGVTFTLSFLAAKAR